MLNRRLFLLLPVGLSSCQYGVVSTPIRSAVFFAPTESRLILIEKLQAFARSRSLASQVKEGAYANQIRVKLYDDQLSITVANPFHGKESEFTVYLYAYSQIPNVDAVWSNLKAQIVETAGVHDWIEKLGQEQ
jgi:hypothetical protein